MIKHTAAVLLTSLLATSFAAAQDGVGASGDTQNDAPLPNVPSADPIDEPETETDSDGASPAAGEADVERAPDEASSTPAADTQQAPAVSLYAKRWDELYNDDDYSSAAAIATEWVEVVGRQHGDDSDELFVPLTRLGQAFESAEDYLRAENAFSRAVAIGERRIGVFDIQNVEPLTGLGRVLMAQGRLDDAVSELLRAKDITHRNLGIFNVEQSDIVDELTESYVGLGEIQQATREQHFVFAANEKQYGAGPELVPALQKWAQWNVRLQRFADARRIYNRALGILEESYGPTDLRLVETLNMIARSFYRNDGTTFPREGAAALRRAVDIYKSQSFVDQADLMRAQTRLGDWYMLAGARSRSLNAYQEAVSSALDSGVDGQLVEAIYGQPRPLQKSDLPVGILGSRLSKLTGGKRHILAEFNVDARGRTRNIRIIEDTVGLVSVAREIRNRISGTAFRPRFENGEPTVSQGVRMFFEFNVDPAGVERTLKEGEQTVIEPPAPAESAPASDQSEN